MAIYVSIYIVIYVLAIYVLPIYVLAVYVEAIYMAIYVEAEVENKHRKAPIKPPALSCQQSLDCNIKRRLILFFFGLGFSFPARSYQTSDGIFLCMFYNVDMGGIPHLFYWSGLMTHKL